MSNSTPQTQHNQNQSLPRIKRPRKGMHREDIKGELRKRGYTLVRVARESGRHHSGASNVLSHSWPALERVIAKILDREPWQIWPNRYNDYGQSVQEGNPNLLKVSKKYHRVNVEDGGEKTT